MIRTFIAIDLPEGVREELDTFERELQSAGAPVAWVKPDRIHLTLKFLGDVPPEGISEIRKGIEKAAESCRSFRLQPSGCGAFPSLKQMRVVWVGLRGDEAALMALQQKIEEAAVDLGFKKEDRPFRAHLTLGRVKGSHHLRSLQDLLASRRSFEAEAFDVNDVVLYKSDLRPEGARYTPLFRKTLNT